MRRPDSQALQCIAVCARPAATAHAQRDTGDLVLQGTLTIYLGIWPSDASYRREMNGKYIQIRQLQIPQSCHPSTVITSPPWRRTGQRFRCAGAHSPPPPQSPRQRGPPAAAARDISGIPPGCAPTCSMPTLNNSINVSSRTMTLQAASVCPV